MKLTIKMSAYESGTIQATADKTISIINSVDDTKRNPISIDRELRRYAITSRMVNGIESFGYDPASHEISYEISDETFEKLCKLFVKGVAFGASIGNILEGAWKTIKGIFHGFKDDIIDIMPVDVDNSGLVKRAISHWFHIVDTCVDGTERMPKAAFTSMQMENGKPRTISIHVFPQTDISELLMKALGEWVVVTAADNGAGEPTILRSWDEEVKSLNTEDKIALILNSIQW